MTFNVNVGFGDLTNDGKKYALFLGDTVLVNEVCYLFYNYLFKFNLTIFQFKKILKLLIHMMFQY